MRNIPRLDDTVAGLPYVYTYYEQDNILDDRSWWVDVWAETWARFGWIPVLLTEKDARKHPEFGKFFAHVVQLPTVNPARYELNCYLRWLAFDIAGKKNGIGATSDADVLNYGLLADDALPGNNDFSVLDESCCPCAAIGNNANMVIELMYRYHHPVLERGNPHCSDMLFFHRNRHIFNAVPVVREVGSDGWASSKLVHFSSGALYNCFGLHKNCGAEAIYGLRQFVRFNDVAAVTAETGREDTQGCYHSYVGNHILPSDCSVLDVGSGLGGSVSRMSGPQRKIVTFEPNPDMGTDLSGDLKDIPDNSFDYVTCFDVIEHVENPFALLLDMRRIAKTSAIITTPNRYATGNTHVYHWHEFSPEEIIRLGDVKRIVAMPLTGGLFHKSHDEFVSSRDYCNFLIEYTA